MTKKELVEEIAQAMDITKKEAACFIDTFNGIVVGHLKSDNEFPLNGIGKLSVKTSSKREGRDPRTGEKVSIPEKKVVRFKAAKALKDSLNPAEAKVKLAKKKSAK